MLVINLGVKSLLFLAKPSCVHSVFRLKGRFFGNEKLVHHKHSDIVVESVVQLGIWANPHRLARFVHISSMLRQVLFKKQFCGKIPICFKHTSSYIPSLALFFPPSCFCLLDSLKPPFYPHLFFDIVTSFSPTLLIQLVIFHVESRFSKWIPHAMVVCRCITHIYIYLFIYD